MRNSTGIILIEETHYYQVDLEEFYDNVWQQAEGQVNIRIPFTKKVFPALTNHDHHLGNLQIKMPGMGQETKPIKMPVATNHINTHLKSAKQVVWQGTYHPPEPKEFLLSFEAEVTDTEDAFKDVVTGKEKSFHNPLQLHLKLRIPRPVAPSISEQYHRLNALLLKGENSQNIFIQSLRSAQENLGKNLCALANTLGGTLLIGVNEEGEINGLSKTEQPKLVQDILLSALTASPPIPLQSVLSLDLQSEGIVTIIEVPPNDKKHQWKNKIYIRKANKTIEDPIKEDNKKTAENQTTKTANFPPKSHSATLTLLENSKGARLKLGAYIAGLINSGKVPAYIDIKYDQQSNTLPGKSQTVAEFEEYLKKELQFITPPIYEPQIEANEDRIRVAIPSVTPLLALYRNNVYFFSENRLINLDMKSSLERYTKFNRFMAHVPGGEATGAFLECAKLQWPIAPPSSLETSKRKLPIYNSQYHAQVWKPTPFKYDTNTQDYILNLTTPLHFSHLNFGDTGDVIETHPSPTGNLRIRLNNTLLSGMTIETEKENDKDESVLETLPIVQRTVLDITFNVRPVELFERRSKASLIQFVIPEVMLNQERLDDIQQACMDTGFRITSGKAYLQDLGDGNQVAYFEGIRRQNHFDIRLYAGFICRYGELQRELHYESWSDSKSSITSSIEVRLALQGTGNVGENLEHLKKEIANLQINLHQTISDRLLHLRVE